MGWAGIHRVRGSHVELKKSHASDRDVANNITEIIRQPFRGGSILSASGVRCNIFWVNSEFYNSE